MNLTQRSVSVLIYLILVRGFLTPSILADCATQTEISQVECEALVDLYTSTNGSSWTESTGWNADDFPCSWYGVNCSGGFVRQLNLRSNNLIGPLPTSLGNLSSLEYLSLRYNQLTGTVPIELGSLANLRVLDLDTNQLNGTIPIELGSLLNLQYLSLSGNQLDGSIPTELGSLSNLEDLALYNNQLNGTIPTELGSLVNLQYLGLGRNQLNGNIPIELGSLTSLETLDLNNNQLNGTIPIALGSLLNLQFLSISQNQLIGSIPVELGNLSNLIRLYLSINQLTGSIPAELGNLANLQYLYLNNNQLTGTLPSELGNLSSLEYLNLSDNQLRGSVPLSVAAVGAVADTCDFTDNDPNLCIPGTPDYQAIGEDPICGLALDITCDPPVSNLSLDKSNVDFGVVSSGSIKDETVTVTNTGTSILVIGSVISANPLETPFSIITDNCSGQAISPSQSCTIIVQFAPSNSGDYFDSFDIPSNDSDSPITVSVHAYCKFPWLMFGPVTNRKLQQ